MSQLQIAQFGSKVLRAKTKAFAPEEIGSKKVQRLIKDMRVLLLDKKLGIGLAAPQVGQGIALAVIAIRPSERRPKAQKFDLVMINPEIKEFIGRKKPMWEGCISSGRGGRANLFAQVPRHKAVKVSYFDEKGQQHIRVFEGLEAQVAQHEIDHLNGVLFVDRVKNTKSYMTYKEYKKMIQKEFRENN